MKFQYFDYLADQHNAKLMKILIYFFIKVTKDVQNSP